MANVEVKDSHYFIVCIDLYKEKGTDEAGFVLTDMMERAKGDQESIAVLHEILNEVLEIHRAKTYPN